jgi:hypothetical protein
MSRPRGRSRRQRSQIDNTLCHMTNLLVNWSGLLWFPDSILDVFRHRLLFGNRAGHGGETDRAGPPLRHLRLEPPPNDSLRVQQVRRCINHGTGPVLVANRSDLSAQATLGIADEPQRKGALGILPKGMVRFVSCLIELGIANDSLAELPAVFRRLRANSEDGDVVFSESFVLVDKGRDLGPTPGSPLPPVEENDGGWRLTKDRWKLNRISLDILQRYCGKLRFDI